MRNHYCCCLIVGENDGKYIFVHDSMTLPNPKKDKTAKQTCITRANILRAELKKRGTPLYKMYIPLIGRLVRVEPMEMIGIEE